MYCRYWAPSPSLPSNSLRTSHTWYVCRPQCTRKGEKGEKQGLAGGGKRITTWMAGPINITRPGEHWLRQKLRSSQTKQAPGIYILCVYIIFQLENIHVQKNGVLRYVRKSTFIKFLGVRVLGSIDLIFYSDGLIYSRVSRRIGRHNYSPQHCLLSNMAKQAFLRNKRKVYMLVPQSG